MTHPLMISQVSSAARRWRIRRVVQHAFRRCQRARQNCCCTSAYTHTNFLCPSIHESRPSTHGSCQRARQDFCFTSAYTHTHESCPSIHESRPPTNGSCQHVRHHFCCQSVYTHTNVSCPSIHESRPSNKWVMSACAPRILL